MKTNLRDLEYSRKATDWKEVDAIPASLLEGHKLPQADILGARPIDYFQAKAPAVIFLARNQYGLFLINTEGFEYPRYTLKVKEVR